MRVKSGEVCSVVKRSMAVSAVAVSVMMGNVVGGAGAYAADMYRGGSLKDSPDLLPVAPVWRGLYAGGHIGGVWSDVDVGGTYTYLTIDPTIDASLSSNGVIAGGQIGYNLQSGNLVYGLEADLGYLGVEGSATTQLQGTPGLWWTNPLSANYKATGGLYGDITGRLGYAAGPALFYAKGGAAFLNVDLESHYTGRSAFGNNIPYDYQDSETFWGWTIGGGVEYKLRRGWSLKVEYQHFDFGSETFSHDTVQRDVRWSGQLQTDAKVSPTADAVTVGVNYHFGEGR